MVADTGVTLAGVISSGQIAVDDSPAVLLAAPNGTMRVRIFNSGPNEVYLGPAGVTSNTGAQLANGATEAFEVDADLWGICASGETCTLQVLRTGEGGVHASFQTNLGGANEDLKFTVTEPGAPGNSYTIEYAVDGNDTPLSVVRTGRAFVVNVETDEDGDPVSAAQEVMDAVNEEWSGYLVAELKSGNDGTGVVSVMSAQAFTGGA